MGLKREQSRAVQVGHAPMEGLLRNIQVQAGQKLEAGQVLFTLESMKMQVQITASEAGQVAEICAQPGETVKKGQQIIRWHNES